MVTASATYFYLADQGTTDLSQERRWQAAQEATTSSGPAPWRWAPAPARR